MDDELLDGVAIRDRTRGRGIRVDAIQNFPNRRPVPRFASIGSLQLIDDPFELAQVRLNIKSVRSSLGSPGAKLASSSATLDANTCAGAPGSWSTHRVM